MIPAVKRSTAVLAVALLIAGCGARGSISTASPSTKASSSPLSSPIASAVASPLPLTGAFAVLVTPPAIKRAKAAGALVPMPVSPCDDGWYYQDAQGVLRHLTAQG